MDRRKLLIPVALAAACAGCHGGPTPEFPDWVAPNVQASNQGDERGGSFSLYARAAIEAEKDGASYLNMVSFYPFQRRNAMKATDGALKMLIEAARGKCDFEFIPGDPFKAPPHQRGWRLLGRDLVWKIGEVVRTGNFDEAVANANVATKFGFDISGGSATDASLGLAIANEARQAIAPALDHMDAGQLNKLSAGVSEALQEKPALKDTIEHEHQNMLEGVQAVQDAYRDQRFDELGQSLGPDSRSAIEYLQDLKRKDYSRRPKYFQDFASEANVQVAWAEKAGDMPLSSRVANPPPKLSGERPWKKFSKEFFSSVQPLLVMNDATLARTRLLILEASILAQVKANGAAPKDLSSFPENIKTDPYSGKPFIYGADGADFHVYSVGLDLRDDVGQTDETYSQPDLKLERG